MQSSPLGGAHYVKQGFYLIRQPGIRSFVVIPLIINLILLSTATYYIFDRLSIWYASLAKSEYSVVQWLFSNLEWLLWPITVIIVLIVVFYVFSLIANWIAAPFNGLLSEAVEKHLRQNHLETSLSWMALIKDVPRLIGREWQKLAYYLPRALVCVILLFTPLALIAPIIWFVFNAWMAAIQNIDYPLDNHKVPFNESIQFCKSNRRISLGFGSLVMLLMMIPVVNILVMPIAVAGGTALWFDLTQRKPNT